MPPEKSKAAEKEQDKVLKYLKPSDEGGTLKNREEVYKYILKCLASTSHHPNFWQLLNRKLQSILSDSEEELDSLACFQDGSITLSIYNALVSWSEESSNLNPIIEALTTISETKKGREECSKNLGGMMDVFSNRNLTFSVKLELCKLINILLEHVTKAKINELKKSMSSKTLLERSGDHLREAGDFDLQATILEIVFRLLNDSEKKQYAEKWFKTEMVRTAFLSVKNEDFEKGCRTFLNQLNEHTEKRRVYSFPCIAFYLGTYKLKGPGQHQLENFWVDFNIGSKTMSAFVNDDASDSPDSAWEFVVIKAEKVNNLRINDNGTDLTVILKLSESPHDLLPFCPEKPERYVKVMFSKAHDVTKALCAVFGTVSYNDMSMGSPSMSSTPTKASTVQKPFWLRSFREIELGTKPEAKKSQPEKNEVAQPKVSAEKSDDEAQSTSKAKVESLSIAKHQSSSIEKVPSSPVAKVQPFSKEKAQSSPTVNVQPFSKQKSKSSSEVNLKSTSEPTNNESASETNAPIEDIIPETQEDYIEQVSTMKGKFVETHQEKVGDDSPKEDAVAKSHVDHDKYDPSIEIIYAKPMQEVTELSSSLSESPDKKIKKTKKESKKSRNLPERKAKANKIKAKSYSPFAFIESSFGELDNDNAEQQKESRKEKMKSKAKDSRKKRPENLAPAVASSSKGKRGQKLYGFPLKSSGEEFHPDQIATETTTTWTSSSETESRRPRISDDSSFTDPRMPKKKRVFKTYETKITSKSKKGKLEKGPLVKIKPNHMVKFDLEDYFDDSNTEVEQIEKHHDRREEVEQNDEEISDLNLKKRKAQKKRAAFLKSEKATKKYIAEDESILSKISSECTPETKHYAKKARMKPQVEEDSSLDEGVSYLHKKYDMPKKSKAKKSFLGFEKFVEDGDDANTDDDLANVDDDEDIDEERKTSKKQKSGGKYDSSLHISEVSVCEDEEDVDEPEQQELNTPESPNNTNVGSGEPIHSFESIFQDMVNLSKKTSYAPSPHRKENTIATDTDHNPRSKPMKSSKDLTRLLKPSPFDSGIISDLSACFNGGPSRTPNKVHNEISPIGSPSSNDVISSPERVVGNNREENTVEEDVDSCNEQDDEEDRVDDVLPCLKTPEVVRSFRKNVMKENNAKREKKEKRVVRKKLQSKKRERMLNSGDGGSSSSTASLVPITRKRLPREDFSDDDVVEDDEITPLTQPKRKVSRVGAIDNDLQSMLKSFGDQMQNNVKRKQSLIQKFTDSSTELVMKRFSTVMESQREERISFVNGMGTSIQKEMDKLMKLMAVTQEKEENIVSILLEHQKEKLKGLSLQKQWMENMLKLKSSMFSGIEKLEEKQCEETSTVDKLVRKDLNKMQSNLLRESKKQEILNVQKNLKGLLLSN